MNKDLIERLKDKTYVRAFGLMTNEEQECFKKVGTKNCQKFFTDSRIHYWGNCDHFKYDAFTYAIRPDYQPEPKYKVWDCKIVIPDHVELPGGFDYPPRRAAIEAVENAGITVLSCFSGWGGTLTEIEAKIVRGDEQ